MATDKIPFAYTILRIVPCIERGESLNAGVCLFCRQLDFLGLRIGPDEKRLKAFAAPIDLDAINEHLGAIRAVIEGEEAAGALAAMQPSERFGWLAAPSSTMIQPSPVHTGVTADPAAELDRLFGALVL